MNRESWWVNDWNDECFKEIWKGILAVNNLSVRIQDGEFVYVVGPSGAGKSTFIKMMYRQEKANIFIYSKRGK